MNSLIKKIKGILQEVESEKGAFLFAALIEREDGMGKYDLVVSASWISRQKPFYEYLSPKLKRLSVDEWMKLARVVVLDPGGEFLQEFSRVVGPSVNEIEIMDKRIGGIDVRYAHLFPTTSNALSYAL